MTTKSTASTASALVGAFLLGAATVLLERYLRQRKRGSSGDSNVDERFPAPRRFAAAIRLKPEKYRRYRELHDNVWEEVQERMYQSNIRNFVIYYHEETSTMFQSFEWIGHWKAAVAAGAGADCSDLSEEEEQRLLDRDMSAISDDPVTRRWWSECEPCQQPFSQWKAGSKLPSDGGTGDWWVAMECLCHLGHWPTSYSRQRCDPEFVKLTE